MICQGFQSVNFIKKTVSVRIYLLTLLQQINIVLEDLDVKKEK